MKRTALAVAALILLTAGCSGDDDPVAEPTDTAAPTPTATLTTPAATPTTPATTPSTTATPGQVTLIVAPGSVGDARVGMTKDEAVATGLFDADVETGDESCLAVAPLRWKAAFGDDVDVQTSEDGTITSLGVREPGVSTAPGMGVGSTYAELTATYGDALTPPIESGYGQSGVLLQSGEKYVGFLFDPPFDRLSTEGQDAKVTFMEVSEGEPPALIRDGC